MTIKDGVLLLLGAIVGAIVNGYYETSRSWLYGVMRQRRRRVTRQAALSGKEQDALVAFYRRRGAESSLYETVSFERVVRIPVLIDPDVLVRQQVDRHNDVVLTMAAGAPLIKRNYDRRRIRRAMAAGTRLFDGEILCVRRIQTNSAVGLHVVAERTNYFSYASLVLGIRSSLRSRFRSYPIALDSMLSLVDATRGGVQPQAIGGGAVTIFQSDNGVRRIAIARRSGEVLTETDLLSVAPAYGMESNVVGDARSRYGILVYNYIREFLEEFYNLEEVIDALHVKRAHPDWILRLPEAAAILREIEAGRVHFECLGVGVAPYSGALLLPMLVEFHSAAFLDQLQEDLRANWESATGEHGEPPIRFVDLFGAEIEAFHREGLMDLPSMWAVDVARARITSRESS